MRNMWTADASGLTSSALKWGVKKQKFRRIINGVYGDGPDEPSRFDVAVAEVIRSEHFVATGRLAGVLLRLDAVTLTGRGYARRQRPGEAVTVVYGIRCTDALPTLIDLAADLDDLRWEQALESALRTGGTTLHAIKEALPDLSASRTPGVRRIRRVLKVRGDGPATGSLLETLMVQLSRRIHGLGRPIRQYEVRNAHGDFIAFVDLAWPELGVFIELDGQHHEGQPVYDAVRQTRVAAATGWLCGRFTWHQVTRLPNTSARQLAELVEQARRRPLPAGSAIGQV